MTRDELITHLNTEPSFILMCLSGFVAPQVRGEAGGPAFPLSGHRGLGIRLVLDVFGNLSFSRISNFLSVEVLIDLDSKMAQR